MSIVSDIAINAVAVVLFIPAVAIGIAGITVISVVSKVGSVVYLGGKCISYGCSDSNDVIVSAHIPKSTQ